MMLVNCRYCGSKLMIKSTRGYQFRPYICSSSCFVNWLEKTSHPPIMDSECVSFINSIETYKEYKSGYELSMVKILEKLDIEYEYEKYVVLLKHLPSGRKKIYIPDFYLPKYNCFLEVKGLWKDGAYQKVKLFAERYPLYLITREDIFLLRR